MRVKILEIYAQTFMYPTQQFQEKTSSLPRAERSLRLFSLVNMPRKFCLTRVPRKFRLAEVRRLFRYAEVPRVFRLAEVPSEFFPAEIAGKFIDGGAFVKRCDAFMYVVIRSVTGC